jgi:hypothetical protein
VSLNAAHGRQNASPDVEVSRVLAVATLCAAATIGTAGAGPAGAGHLTRPTTAAACQAAPREHGFDPTHKGFYHGGDLRGIINQLD